jgi:pyruvate formate lyase activating enzyme
MPFLNYIAMDIKTSLENYASLGTKDTDSIMESIIIIKDCELDYEFRCTAVPGFVETETVQKMGEMVRGAKKFVFQQYKPEKTLDPDYNKVKPHSEETIRGYSCVMDDYVNKVVLRV